MKPFDPHKKSRELRRFKPTRKPAGVFTIAVAFCDSSLMALAFFLVVQQHHAIAEVLSFDLLDASCAPGTGTPEIGGFTTHQALQLLVGSCRDMRLVGMDLVEVMPSQDVAGITALAGASLMHVFLAAVAKGKE